MSKINFACPSCNAKYSVPDSAAGKQAKCKSCGKAITVPASAADAMRIKDASASGGGGKMDMSSMYAEASAKSTEPTVQPPGFSFEGSAFNSQQRKSPAISPALLIGGGGGVVVLLLVVVLIVVLSGGKKDKPVDPAVAETPTNRPTRGRTPSRNTPSTNNDNTDTDPEVEVTPDTPFGATALTPPPEDVEILDWTLDLSHIPEGASQQVDHRGMRLHIPANWEAMDSGQMFSGMSEEMAEELAEVFEGMAEEGAAEEFAEGFAEGVESELDEASVLLAGSEEAELGFILSTTPTDRHREAVWPLIYETDKIVPAMSGITEGGGDEMFGDGGFAAGDFSGGGGFAVDADNPDSFFVQTDMLRSIEYGTLFDGYPFVRIELNGPEEDDEFGFESYERRVIYLGYLGDLLVATVMDVTKDNIKALDSIETILRTATLLSESEATAAAGSDGVYRRWITSRDVRLRFAEDVAPMPNMTDALWQELGEDSVFVNLGMAIGAVSPSHQRYAIIPPENLDRSEVSSVSVRWHPDPDTGLWMQLMVSELDARQAHLDSPISTATQEDQPTYALIQGNNVPLPEGFEYSTLDADGLLLHRILLPAVSFSTIQKVYYLAIDGQRQITITGHFNKDNAQDLARLDEAATSLHRFEKQGQSSATQEHTQATEETVVEPEPTPGTEPPPNTRPQPPSVRPGRGQPGRRIPERPGH